MSAQTNISTIEALYEAFGRGDVDTILANVTDDVDWATEASGNDAPWYGPHKGPEEVAAFFTAFGTAMAVEEFTPITYAGTDDEVLTLVRCSATSRQTGKRTAHHLHHYFRFCEGKVAYYRGSEDTAEVAAALAP